MLDLESLLAAGIGIGGEKIPDEIAEGQEKARAARRELASSLFRSGAKPPPRRAQDNSWSGTHQQLALSTNLSTPRSVGQLIADSVLCRRSLPSAVKSPKSSKSDSTEKTSFRASVGNLLLWLETSLRPCVSKCNSQSSTCLMLV